MKDSDFKNAEHPIGNLVIASRETAVSNGYKPDITVKNTQGQLKFIMECEQKTDRKAFLGDLLKAEVYAEQLGSNPELVIVIQASVNTTALQIADHMRPYKQWLESKNGGALNLSAIQILSDAEYLDAIAAGEMLGSANFKLRGHIL